MRPLVFVTALDSAGSIHRNRTLQPGEGLEHPARSPFGALPCAPALRPRGSPRVFVAFYALSASTFQIAYRNLRFHHANRWSGLPDLEVRRPVLDVKRIA